MKKLLFVSLLAVGASSAFAVELMVNGGFEANVVVSPTLPTGWSGTAGGASGVNSGATLGTPHSGTNWYGMGATAATTQTDMFQDVATTIGTTYTASFWARDEDPAFGGHMLVTFGGVQVGPLVGTAVWTQYTINRVATATTTRFEVTGWEPIDWVTVDDFSVQAQAVPEPATMAALGLGVAAMLRRRRKA